MKQLVCSSTKRDQFARRYSENCLNEELNVYGKTIYIVTQVTLRSTRAQSTKLWSQIFRCCERSNFLFISGLTTSIFTFSLNSSVDRSNAVSWLFFPSKAARNCFTKSGRNCAISCKLLLSGRFDLLWTIGHQRRKQFTPQQTSRMSFWLIEDKPVFKAKVAQEQYFAWKRESDQNVCERKMISWKIVGFKGVRKGRVWG